jgi:hypothetical protein
MRRSASTLILRDRTALPPQCRPFSHHTFKPSRPPRLGVVDKGTINETPSQRGACGHLWGTRSSKPLTHPAAMTVPLSSFLEIKSQKTI